MLRDIAGAVVLVAVTAAVLAVLRRRGVFRKPKSGVIVVGLDGDDWKKPE